MQELVFIDSQRVGEEPYTTADVIAEYADSSRKVVNELIRRYKNDLEEFGVLPFQMAKPPKKSKGGRPRKVWQLNQSQATLLITYMDNTKPVRQFKKALVKQFSIMNRALAKQQAAFEVGKQISKEVNAAVDDNPTFTHGRNDYTNVNRMIYKFALGVDTTKLKKERHWRKGRSLTEYLSADEAAAVQRVKGQVIMLLQMNFGYYDIKDALERQGVLYQVTLPVKKGETA